MTNDPTLTIYDANGPFDPPLALPELKDGMVIVLYTDKGPKGVCGQSMSITCPHASLAFFPDEETFRNWYTKHKFRMGNRADVRWWVMGQHGSGRLTIGVHNRL